MNNLLQDMALSTEDLITSIMDEQSFEETIQMLVVADSEYHNGDDESKLTDLQYDLIKRKAQSVQPHHEYFTGVGSNSRGGKVSLPYPMGSLNQKFEGEFDTWISNSQLQNHEFVITDKLDGTSAMVVYDATGKLQIAYSRGNGTHGADISRHISQFAPKKIDISKSLVVRGEVIITRSGFEELNDIIVARSGKPYKNARNLVAGVMNASANDPIIYEYLHFVAYTTLGDQTSKEYMIRNLEGLGFNVPYWENVKSSDVADDVWLRDYLDRRKFKSPYEIDGLVIDVDNAATRKLIEGNNKSSLNPDYSFKYKITDIDNYAETIITDLGLRVSKHGYITSSICVSPVELVGVTVTHANGLNAKYIANNKLRPGTRVAISRMGDVVPNIVKILEQTDVMGEIEYTHWLSNEFDKFGEWDWTDSGVNAYVIDTSGNRTIETKQLLDFFTKLGVVYLGLGNICKLYDAGLKDIASIILSERSTLTNVLGKNGGKVYDSIESQLTDVPLSTLVGAHSSQRGIGVRKMRTLQQHYGNKFIIDPSIAKFELVDKFDTITATSAVTAITEFNEFFTVVEHKITINTNDPVGSSMSGVKCCFTGFRNKELQQKVEDNGGTMQSGVSSKTTLLVTPNPNGTSSKIKKAKDLGIEIISIEELESRLP